MTNESKQVPQTTPDDDLLATRLMSSQSDPDETRMLLSNEDPGATRLLGQDADPGATRLMSQDADPGATRLMSQDADPGATRMMGQDEMPGLSSDETIASPELGFGLERQNMLEPFAEEEKPDDSPLVVTNDPIEHGVEADPLLPTISAKDAPEPMVKPKRSFLSRRKVAAVNKDREYYAGEATPYLSSQQAQEDIRQTKRRQARVRVAIITVVILVLSGAAGWFLWQAIGSRKTEAVTQYDTAKIVLGEFVDGLTVSCHTDPLEQQEISTEISGSIASVSVTNGDHVDEGQEILRMESTTVSDSLQRAQDALDKAQADTDARVAALDQANQVLANEEKEVETLKQNANAGTTGTDPTATTGTTSSAAAKAALAAAEAVLEQAKNNVTEAENRVKDSENTLQAVQETYDLAHEQEQKLTIHAPMSGVVEGLAEDLKEGKSLTNGQMLCTVTDKSHLRIEMEIPEESREGVHEGMDVRLVFPDIPDVDPQSSTISSIEDRDEGSVAIIEIEDPDERIANVNEAKVDASVVLKSIPDSLLVPLDALYTDEDGNSCINILVDETRGIVTKAVVRIIASNKTQAAVSADNIQKDNVVVIGVKDNPDIKLQDLVKKKEEEKPEEKQEEKGNDSTDENSKGDEENQGEEQHDEESQEDEGEEHEE